MCLLLVPETFQISGVQSMTTINLPIVRHQVLKLRDENRTLLTFATALFCQVSARTLFRRNDQTGMPETLGLNFPTHLMLVKGDSRGYHSMGPVNHIDEVAVMVNAHFSNF